MAVPRLSARPTLAAQELAALLGGLLAHEREIVTDFLLHLGEFDRRGFALALGYGSLFDYCTRGLGLSSSAAFRRITAARLLRRFPLIEPMLRDGRLSLTTLTLLKDVLDQRNHRDLLARVAGLSKEQVAALVAVLRPKPAPRDSVRPLPPARLVALPAAALPAASLSPTAARAVPVPAALSTPAREAADEAVDAPSAAAGAPVAAAGALAAPAAPARQVLVAIQPVPPPRVEPISAELRVLKVTVSREFLAELDEVKAALSHTVPSGRFEEVVRACFRLVLARERRRSGPATGASTAPAPGPSASTAASGSGPAPTAAATPAASATKRPERAPVSAELERLVRARDGNRCAVVGPDGRVCGSTYQLELHHLNPVARGGETTADNLLLVCRRHNDWLARQEFGEAHMARCRRRGAATATPALGGGPASTAASGSATGAARIGGPTTGGPTRSGVPPG